jgi:hypothetical protein
MNYFKKLEIGRLNVQLTELTVGKALELAMLPPGNTEIESLVVFLGLSVTETNIPIANWTLQEGLTCLAWYQCCVEANANEPINFIVDNETDGKVLDYVDMVWLASDDSIELDDTYSMTHLTLDDALNIEQLCYSEEFKKLQPRAYWELACMAAQLRCATFELNKEIILADSTKTVKHYLFDTIQSLIEMPESEFEQLNIKFNLGRQRLSHLMKLNFANFINEKNVVTGGGFATFPLKEEKPLEEGGQALKPVRFRAFTALTATVHRLAN